MIDTIAKRRVNFNGTIYQKGATVPMPAQQFNDLQPTGLFARAPKPKAAPKAKATEPKSSATAD